MIVVNARFLTQALSGVQRFAYEISCQLKELYHDEVLFVAPPDTKKSAYSQHLNPVLIGHHSGYLWEQYELPRYLKRIGSPLLVNLCNLAPVFYRNKISTVHDITFVRYPEDYPFRMKWVYKMLIPLILKSSTKIVTVSHFSKDEISDYYRIPIEQFEVVYNAVNKSFVPTRNVQLQSDTYLLAFASTGENKNFRMIIQSFLKVSEQNKNVRLYIIGECQRMKEYDGLKNNDHVVFKGRVSDQELVELYSNAIAFVYPSFYEGFGIPVIEAQACGCPVIASDVTTFPEILKDSALCVDPFSVADLSKAIISMISSQEMRVHYRSKGLENVKRFSWVNSGRRMSEIIDTCK